MIGKIFKYLCFALMFFVVAVLGYRFYTLNYYPDFAEAVIRTDALVSGYNADTLSGKTWKTPDKYDVNGYFFVHQPIYFENEKTLIITIRYNNSLLEKLKFDGSSEELDLFPSLRSEGSERILPFAYRHGEAYGIYSYRRYVFENVELEDTKQLLLDVHLDEAYEEAPYARIEIYKESTRLKNYKLTRNDKNELK